MFLWSQTKSLSSDQDIRELADDQFEEKRPLVVLHCSKREHFPLVSSKNLWMLGVDYQDYARDNTTSNSSQIDSSAIYHEKGLVLTIFTENATKHKHPQLLTI